MKKLLIIALLSVATSGAAQNRDTLFRRYHIVKLVLTPRVLYPGSFVLSYERMMKRNQSLNITAGTVPFPDLVRIDFKVVDKSNSKIDFMVGADYRFYLQNENKFPAPRGVYIGPYISYYQFSNERALQFGTGSNVTLQSDMAFFNIGGQMGYQFVLKDRWSFDFIFLGPSISNYKLDFNLQGVTLTPEEEGKIIKAITDRFPLLGELIDDKSISLHGHNAQWTAGYRFTAMIGYKFAVGKK